MNQFGDGKVYYVGCDLNEAALLRLIKDIAKDVSIAMEIPSVEGVEIIKKEKDGKTFFVIMDHSNNPKCIALTGEHHNIITGEAVINNICLEAYGVAILV